MAETTRSAPSSAWGAVSQGMTFRFSSSLTSRAKASRVSGRRDRTRTSLRSKARAMTGTAARAVSPTPSMAITDAPWRARLWQDTVAAAPVLTEWHQSSSMMAVTSPPCRSLRMRMRRGPCGGRDGSRLPPAALMARKRKPAAASSEQPVTQYCHPSLGLTAKSSGTDQPTRPALWSCSADLTMSMASPRSSRRLTSSLER